MTPPDPELLRLQREWVLACFRCDDTGEMMDLGERDRLAAEIDERIEFLAKQEKQA